MVAAPFPSTKTLTMPLQNNFDEDVRFLDKTTETVILEGDEPGRVVVAPDFQCRTMTSSTGHPSWQSPGWINYRQITDGATAGTPALFGGEDRVWLAPEGSQFSLFFDQGKKMELANWRVPESIEHFPFEFEQLSPLHIEMTCQSSIENYAGTKFDFQLSRVIQWHSRLETEQALDITIPKDAFHVSHSSTNTLFNTGHRTWSPESGLPAIWILGMFKPSRASTVIIPFLPAPVIESAPVVTTKYFGSPDTDRLHIDSQKNLIYFMGDGQFRSKIGVPGDRATNLLGSWDSHRRLLTIVQFELPESTSAGYVNNLWQTDLDSFGGDIVNAYNDGPNETGGMLGPFYELESLSPALSLPAGESATHTHRTIHFEGTAEVIDEVTVALFGVTSSEIACVFG